MKPKMRERARKIKMLILDIDGVMTDGRIIYDNKGNELKCFNVLDGMGLALLKRTKIKLALITAKSSKAVLRRGADIGAVEIKQNSHDKLPVFQKLITKHKLRVEDICFIGDDLPDLPIIRRVGFAVTVPGACAEVKEHAHYITKCSGGKGAVREVVELILRSQNKWKSLIEKYMKLVLILILPVVLFGCAQEETTKVQTRDDLTDAAQKELENASDEMFSSFSISGYGAGGRKEWDLEGKSADIMSEEIQLTDVTGKVYGDGTTMTITADEGSLNRVNNNVHLEKNVVAVSDDGATLTTDYLDWNAQDGELSTDAPVHIKRGFMEAEGIGMIAQPELNLVEIKKDVKVKIAIEVKDNNVSGENVAIRVSKPTIITCDGPLEVDYENNLATFYKNVKVNDSRGEIFAERMDVYFSSDSQQQQQIEGMEGMGIEKIVAVKDVEIHHGSNITYSQKAVYDAQSGKLTLTGRPKLVIYSAEGFGQLMGGE